MSKQKSIVLPNNILILITLKIIYATFEIDTRRSKYNLKAATQLIDLCVPYRHKNLRVYASKTGGTIFDIKKEYVEELTQKLTEFLTKSENLIEITLCQI